MLLGRFCRIGSSINDGNVANITDDRAYAHGGAIACRDREGVDEIGSPI